MIPVPGDMVRITRRCGVVAVNTPYLFRVSKVEAFTHTPGHMVYLAGYELDSVTRLAVEHRPMLLVEHAGIELVDRARPATPGKRTHRNAQPAARTPQQRTRQTGPIR